MKKPIVVGIAGGTGSGKSTITSSLKEKLKDSVVVIEQDSYYKDQSSLPFEERIKTNYDHPFAFDNDLLVEHVLSLKEQKSIEKPIYDFETHNRKKETILVEPCDVIIVEGILILYEEAVRDLLDIKIFVDTDSDVRIIRRILRDTKERGRSLESILTQYQNTVKPMHEEFIEPSKKHADIIIPRGGENAPAIKMLVQHLKTFLNKNEKK